jgi:thymidylate synthase (FAD)
MPRLIASAAEALLDVPVPVLDQGQVMLVDYLGTDARVVDAARTSYTTGTKKVSEDRALINHLLRNAHTSPFEQVILVFRLILPLFVAAQIVRHRTARLNSESFRFSEATDRFYLPDALRNQDTVNKQGSVDGPFMARPCATCGGAKVVQVPMPELEPGEPLTFEDACFDCGASGVFTEALGLEIIRNATEGAFARYQDLIKGGVSRELARIILPQNLYTTWYWQVDLHNLFHFLRLRLDWHAQWEVRQYAGAMAHAARAVAPLCFEAFEEHVLHAVRLSLSELEAVRRLLSAHVSDPEGKLDQAAAQCGITSERQRLELRKKLLALPALGNTPTLGGGHAA